MAPIAPIPKSRLDHLLNWFQSALTAAGEKGTNNLDLVTHESLYVFFDRINNTPAQTSVVYVDGLSPIIFIFDKLVEINASNQFMPRSLNALFGVLKHTLVVSQNSLGTAFHGGSLLVTLADAIRQVDDPMFASVPVGYIYEIFEKMSCEIVDCCRAFVSEAPKMKRGVTQDTVRTVYKNDLDACLTHLNQHYQAYNSLLGRQIANPPGEETETSAAADERKKIAENEAIAVTVESWLDSIVDGKINVTHITMQEARQKETKTGTGFVKKLCEWLSQKKSNIFWATGIPGAGKSILMSTFVDHLAAEEKTLGLAGSAYFYFLYDNASSQEVRFYASLLRQLYRKDKILQEDVNSLHDSLKKDNLKAATHHLADIFHDLKYEQSKETNPKFVIALDALDEISQASQKALVSFIEGLDPKIFYVLVTARDSLEIKVPNHATLFKIQADANDMEIYIRHSLASSSTLLSYTKSERSRSEKVNEIVENLLRNASGMFLITRYQVEHLLHCNSVGEMLRTAKDLKEDGIDNFHRRTYQQICKQKGTSPEVALRILSWLVFSKRPLSEEEVGEAVAIRNSNTFVSGDDRLSKDTIIKLCRGLVIYDHSRRVMRLSHKTVQDYFQDELRDLYPGVVLDCFRYLCFKRSPDDENDSNSNEGESKTDRYTSDTESEIGEETQQRRYSLDESSNDGDDNNHRIPSNLANRYLQKCDPTEYVCTWGIDHLRELQNDQVPVNEGDNMYPKHFTPFHYVMLFGQPKVLHTLMEEANDSNLGQSMIECQDCEGRTPLMWALQSGNAKVIDAVFDFNPNITHQDKLGNQALYYAASCPPVPALKDLIQRSKPIRDETIASAVKATNVPLVRAFLEAGANPSAILENGDTLLHLAVTLSPDSVAGEMVTLLLQWKANLNAQNDSKKTALHFCFIWRSPLSLLAFLNAKPMPDFNIQDDNGNSPIHGMASSTQGSTFDNMGQKSPMKRLTKLNANVFLKNNEGNTPLHLAAEMATKVMSDLLTRAKAQRIQNPELDLDARNNRGQTILELAFSSRDQSTIDALLKDEGVSVDASGMNGGHPLKWAVQRKLTGTAEAILKRSTENINVSDINKNTALHDAGIHNSTEVAKILLQYHADATLVNKNYRTPLEEAAKAESFETLQLLLEEQERINTSAKLDWKTDHNKRALLWAAWGGNLKCLELLIKPYGYQINSRFGDGSTCENADFEGMDATPTGEGFEGFSVLHFSVMRRSLPCVKLVLENKPDVNLLSISGQTPLDLALKIADASIIEELLEHYALSGMPWEVGLLINKWKSEPWYDILQWQLTASERWDPAINNKASTAWARTTRCMTHEKDYIESTLDKPYIEVAIPDVGPSPVRRIRFHFRSHDQGWANDAERFRGSYFNSCTWFEVGIKHKNPPSTSATTQGRRLVQRNQYAVGEFQEHIVLWDHRDMTPGMDDWLRLLQPGDKIQVYPKARYRGWRNTVAFIKIDVFYKKPLVASAPLLSHPRLVLYHQTTHTESGHVPLIPLIGTDITHLVVSAIHLNSDPGDIHLNNEEPLHKLFTNVWTEVAQIQASDIKLLGKLGGSVEGTYPRLDKDDATFEAYYLPLKALIQTHKLEGLDLDVKESMSLSSIIRLIDRLRADFGHDFLIILTSVAASLLHQGNSISGFDYFALHRERGSEIAWYNVQFYNGGGDFGHENVYNNILCMGWDPSKVVACILTNEADGEGYTELDKVKGTISILREQHWGFGGLAGWEYFDAGDRKPEEWVTNMAKLMNRGVEEGSEVVRRLAMRWKEKALSPRLPGTDTSESLVDGLAGIVLKQMKILGGPKTFSI